MSSRIPLEKILIGYVSQNIQLFYHGKFWKKCFMHVLTILEEKLGLKFLLKIGALRTKNSEKREKYFFPFVSLRDSLSALCQHI